MRRFAILLILIAVVSILLSRLYSTPGSSDPAPQRPARGTEGDPKRHPLRDGAEGEGEVRAPVPDRSKPPFKADETSRVFRLGVRQDGEGICKNQVLQVLVKTDGQDATLLRIQTDADGRARLVWPGDRPAVGQTVRIQIPARNPKSGHWIPASWRGDITVGNEHARIGDLGWVTLQSLPIVIDGQVTDMMRKPLPGAAVTVELEAAGTSTAVDLDTDVNGRFQLAWDDPVLSVAVTARKRFYVPSERESVRVGRRGIVLQLAPAGTIRGSIVLDREMHDRVKLVVLDSHGRRRECPGLYSRPNQAVASFLIKDVPLGTAEIQFWVAERIAATRRVAVRKGDAAATAKLTRVDLR